MKSENLICAKIIPNKFIISAWIIFFLLNISHNAKKSPVAVVKIDKINITMYKKFILR